MSALCTTLKKMIFHGSRHRYWSFAEVKREKKRRRFYAAVGISMSHEKLSKLT